MHSFYKTVPHTPSKHFCTECAFNNRKFSEIQDKHFTSRCFSHEGVCFQKYAFRLLNQSVSKKVKRKFSAK